MFSDVVVDLPGVGEHLTDHVSMGVTYKFNSSIVPISGGKLPVTNRLFVVSC